MTFSSSAAMQPVDYEQIAVSYDRRYASNDFADIARCVTDFVGDAHAVAELGCGTGHWLALATSLPHRPFVVGIDRAWAMLSHARENAPDAACIRGSAECLPCNGEVFDRVICIHA